ncbi:hypothetical protein HNR30_008501 [Nonomuraea soli]|uniref:Uncharacterized protein n=1 Tax=Nonomuraea soli TaxID=1032476 RepID=A0A7W0CTR4_9ACTN|nr:hypothetical protein [Nonomuraea soli]
MRVRAIGKKKQLPGQIHPSLPRMPQRPIAPPRRIPPKGR